MYKTLGFFALLLISWVLFRFAVLFFLHITAAIFFIVGIVGLTYIGYKNIINL